MAQMEDLVQQMNQAGVTVYQPDDFDVRGFIHDVANGNNGDLYTFQSVSENITLNFYTEFHFDGSGYCSVEVDDNQGRRSLLSEDDRGNVTGHINEVEMYLSENCADGFFDRDEAREKIPDFESLFDYVDEDYLEYMRNVMQEEDDEDLMALNVEPVYEPDIEDIMEPEEPKPSLDDLSEAEQLEEIMEALEPGGDLYMMLRDFEQAEGRIPSAETKFDRVEFDDSLSDKTKEYFEASKEKQPFFTVMKTGFVPFEIRDGFVDRDGNPPHPDMVLTQDIVKEVRAKIDPDFGKVMGVDTTQFHPNREPGIEKNISIIPMNYDDIKQYVAMEASFSEENVRSVRAVKEYGSSMEVQGTKYGVNNLVTFEVRTTDNEVYRSTLIVNDSGTAIGRLDSVPDDYEHTFRMDTGHNEVGGGDLSFLHFDKLDRTDPDMKGHFRAFEGKNEEFREKYMEEVSDRMPGFMAALVDEFNHDLEPDNIEEIGRKDYLEISLSGTKAKMDSLHAVTNTVELYRENLEAKAFNANQEASHIEDQINTLSMRQKDIKEDPIESQKLEDQIDSLKDKYVLSYKDYVENKEKYVSFTEESKEIRQAFDGFEAKYKSLNDEYGKLFLGVSANGSGMDTKPEKMTPMERFSNLCDITQFRDDMVPERPGFDLDRLTEAKEDIIREAVDGISSLVDTYNASIDCPLEKISFLGEIDGDENRADGVAGLYTASGFAIEAKHIVGNDVIANRYDAGADREVRDEGINNLNVKPYIDKDGQYDLEMARGYSEEKPVGSDRTRTEIRDDFLKEEIHCGHNEREITLFDNSLSERMIDTGLLHDLKDLKLAVDAHPYDKIPDLETLKQEKEEISKQRPDPVTYDDTNDAVDPSPRDNSDDSQRDDASNEQQKNQGFGGEKGARHFMAGAFGKIDAAKHAGISDEKKAEIEKEATEKAKETGQNKEDIVKEQTDALSDKLSSVRSDILHFKDKMDSIAEGLPPKMAGQHTGYQAAKVEYDSAIRAYEKMGGAVGTDCFVTKGVSKGELLFSKMDLQSSNLIATKVIDAVLGRMDTKDTIRGIYRTNDNGEVRHYGGMITQYVDKVMNIGDIFSAPFIKLYTFMQDKLDIDIEKYMGFKPEERNPDNPDGSDPVDNRDTGTSDVDEPDKDPSDTDASVEVEPTGESAENIEKGSEDMEQTESDTERIESENGALEAAPQEEKESDKEEVERSEKDHEEQMEYTEDRTEKDDTEEKKDLDAQDEKQLEKKESPVDRDTKQENLIEEEPQKEDTKPEEKDVERKEESKQVEKSEKEEDRTEKPEKEEDRTEKQEKDSDKTEKSEKETDRTEKQEKEADKIEKNEDKIEKDEAKEDRDHTEKPEDVKDKADRPEEAVDNTVDAKPEDVEKDISDATERTEEEPSDVTRQEEESEKVFDRMEIAEPESEDLSQNDLEQEEPDTVSKDEDIQNEKTDAAISFGEDLPPSDVSVHDTSADMDGQHLIDEGEDGDETDSTRNLQEHFDGKDAEEDAAPDFFDTAVERVEDVLSGREELSEFLNDVSEYLADGLDPIDMLDSMAEGIASAYMEDTATIEGVSDMAYEVSNLIDGAPLDTLNLLYDDMQGNGVDAEFIDQVENNVAGTFEEMEDTFPDTAMGEYEGFEFDAGGVHDFISGDVDMDNAFSSPENLSDFAVDAMNYVDMDGALDMDLDALDLAADVQRDLESQGLDSGLANDFSADAYDQIANDAANGVDITNQDYQDSLVNDITARAEDMMADNVAMDVDAGSAMDGVEAAQDDFFDTDVGTDLEELESGIENIATLLL